LQQPSLICPTPRSGPDRGRISRKLVTEGNLINAGQDLLTTIVSIDPIHFYFDVDDRLPDTRAWARQ